MNEDFSIRVVRNLHGGAKVYINGEEVTGNRLFQITVDLTGAVIPKCIWFTGLTSFLWRPQMMTDAQVKAIEAVLAKGDRVELIPVKDGVKVVQVKRKEIK